MMWKYIPYSVQDSKHVYYRRRKMMSYNCKTNIIIGARGLGKTYNVKEYCISRFLHKNEKFVWVRDTEEAKKELCNKNGINFFADVA